MNKNVDGSKGGFLIGDSHDEPSGGIGAVVAGSDQKILLEGNEVILNKTNMASNKEYTVSGTPKEIASAINSVDDNGVVILHGAEMTDHSTGETKIMERGGYIEGSYSKYLWWLVGFFK